MISEKYSAGTATLKNFNKLRMKKIWPFVIVVIFLALLFVFNKNNQVTDSGKYIKIAGQEIKIDLAITKAEQNQGLSGRTPLKENEGMLFVFEKPGKYAFWMKDMNFPIDIVWLDSDLRVVYIKKDARPESYPEAFGSTEDASYVLEVVSGFSEKNNLTVGDTVEFLYQ
jgi:uncharacterized membrane protein (UPF0127 family)